ncbi:MAG: 50S ribosomal protein L9 [Wenzhouxiangellaceae bacterium]
MELILLEKIRNLGDFGDKVRVRPGYGRNFLLPRGKAVPATPENIARFEARREELLRQANERLAAAVARREALDGIGTLEFTVRVSPEGRLYGSIGPREIAEKLTELGCPVDKAEIEQPDGAIRETGEFSVGVNLHADVRTTVLIRVIDEDAAGQS